MQTATPKDGRCVIPCDACLCALLTPSQGPRADHGCAQQQQRTGLGHRRRWSDRPRRDLAVFNADLFEAVELSDRDRSSKRSQAARERHLKDGIPSRRLEYQNERQRGQADGGCRRVIETGQRAAGGQDIVIDQGGGGIVGCEGTGEGSAVAERRTGKREDDIRP